MEDLDEDDQQIANTTTTVHSFKLAPELGKNQFQYDLTIKTKFFVLPPFAKWRSSEDTELVKPNMGDATKSHERILSLLEELKASHGSACGFHQPLHLPPVQHL